MLITVVAINFKVKWALTTNLATSKSYKVMMKEITNGLIKSSATYCRNSPFIQNFNSYLHMKIIALISDLRLEMINQ